MSTTARTEAQQDGPRLPPSINAELVEALWLAHDLIYREFRETDQESLELIKEVARPAWTAICAALTRDASDEIDFASILEERAALAHDEPHPLPEAQPAPSVNAELVKAAALAVKHEAEDGELFAPSGHLHLTDEEAGALARAALAHAEAQPAPVQGEPSRREFQYPGADRRAYEAAHAHQPDGDLVNLLRSISAQPGSSTVCADAADLIERLQADLAAEREIAGALGTEYLRECEQLRADLAKAREEAASSRRVTVAAGKLANDYLQRIAELEAEHATLLRRGAADLDEKLAGHDDQERPEGVVTEPHEQVIPPAVL